MYSYRQPEKMSVAGWSALPGRVALALLVALSLLAISAIAVPSRAQAAGGGPQIKFAAPIYAGQNNGFAEGPVGAVVSVQGSGWTPGGGTVTITLADEQNDTASQPGSACTNGSQAVSIPGLNPQTPDGSGNFTASFQWPAAAGTKGHAYWACGTQASATAAGVDKFTVLSANPPSLVVAGGEPFAGSTISVGGENWLPGGINITVIIAPCVACEPPYSSNAQATSDGNGNFSVTVQVPPAAPVGTTLYVSAQNVDSNNSANSGALNAGNPPSPATQFTVPAQPTPTPTPTTAPSPTPTSTPTATSGAGGTGGNTNTSSGNAVLIVLLAALGVVLLIAAIVAVLLFLRSRGPAPETSGPGSAPYGGGAGYVPPGSQYGGPRRTRDPSGPPSYAETNLDYYAPRSGPAGQAGGWGNAGGWQGAQPGPEGDGDEPTIGMQNPWH